MGEFQWPAISPLYEDGFGSMCAVRLKIGTLFITTLKEETTPTIEETREKR